MQRVFVSSTGKDLADYRESARGAIEGLDGFHADAMENWGARDAAPEAFDGQRIATAHVFVLILGHRYGSSPPGEKLSYTELEYEAAVRLGKPRLVFVADDNLPLLPAWDEPANRQRRQKALRKRVLDGPDKKIAKLFEPDAARLGQYITQALHHLKPPAPSVAPAPFTVPSPVADFTGRDDEIAVLTAALAPSGRASVSAIDGMGGMGKSQLACELAFRLADRFPDGRIFIDLQGTGERPLAPEDAMARVIEAFSPDARPPGEPDRLKAAYQQTLAGKRALLLLDNAADTKQVAPLLPPAPVALLVTSRRRLLLQGARSLELRTLTPASALLLLRGMVPEPRADDAALATIARHCGRLPLALRAAGSFLQVHLSWTAGEYLEAVASERTRLAALAVPEAQVDVKAVLGLSLGKLSEEDPGLAAAWTLLAVFPAGFDREAAAAVWQQDPAPARDRLDALVNRSLLTADQEARFRLHDLLRDLAREQAEATALQAAHLRHGEHYVSVLARANELYLAGTPLDGLALFDSERANIEAAQAWAEEYLHHAPEAARLCFDLTNAGAYLLDLRLPPRVRIGWLEAAREGCRVTGNRRGEGQTLGNLGNAWAALGETRKAIELYEQHLAIAREIGDRRGEGAALGNLGAAWAALGETRKAIELYEQDLAIAREIGDRRGEGQTLGNLGLAWAALGETRKAIELYERQLAIAREIGDRRGEGQTLGNLGVARAALGETRKAIELYEQDLAIAREIGDRRGEGAALGNLGLAWAALGETRKAIGLYEQQLAITREIGDRQGEGNALGNLGVARAALGETRKAIEHYEQQLAITREIGDRRGENTALWNLALAYEKEGDQTEAVRLATLSLSILREIEDPFAPEIEAWLRERGIEP